MSDSRDIQLILGNSNKRFSGVTSTMLQLLPHQRNLMNLTVMGHHHLPADTPHLSFLQTARLCRSPHPDGLPRIFHARRNNEMIQALLLKKFFGAHIKIAFTSTAQRHHSRFTKWLMRQMDGIITTCSAAGSYLMPPADITIPHGIDTATYFPAADKAAAWSELGLKGKYGIGIFGRVRHQKGIDILIEAAIPLLQQNPDPALVIVGEITPSHQSFLDALLQKCTAAGIRDRVHILGKLPFPEIPKLFRAMSLVAALSRNEGYGLTVPEAMASATAVLASEAGAWKDIIRQGTDGFTVPCGDIAATRDKLALLLSDSSLLLELGKNGHQRVLEHYTIQREADALCSFFTALRKKLL